MDCFDNCLTTPFALQMGLRNAEGRQMSRRRRVKLDTLIRDVGHISVWLRLSDDNAPTAKPLVFKNAETQLAGGCLCFLISFVLTLRLRSFHKVLIWRGSYVFVNSYKPSVHVSFKPHSSRPVNSRERRSRLQTPFTTPE